MNHSKILHLDFENARFERYLEHNKNTYHLLTRFLTEHCRLRMSLIKMGLSETDDGRFCGQEEGFSIHLATGKSRHYKSKKAILKFGEMWYRSFQVFGLKGMKWKSSVRRHKRS